MLFEKITPIKLIQRENGFGVGTVSGNKFIYFGEPLIAYQVALRQARKILNYFRLFGAMIFCLGFWFLFFYLSYQSQQLADVFTWEFWLTTGNELHLLFWFGFISIGYFFYRWSVFYPKAELINYRQDKENNPVSPLLVSDWNEANRLPRRKRLDISLVLTNEAQEVLIQAYQLAQKRKADKVSAIDLFIALLNFVQVKNTFIRLGISSKSLKVKAEKLLLLDRSKTSPIVGEDVWQIIFRSYEYAVAAKQEYLHLTELLSATINYSEKLQEILYDYEIDKNKLTNVIEWARVKEKIRREYKKMSRVGSHRSKYGLDRAMTAVATPYLNSFSQDLTMSAKFGHLDACVARDKEIEEVFRIISGGRQNIVLVGESGVGKMSIIEGIAQKMVGEDVPERLSDKRLVQLSVSSLLAGVTVSGAQERLNNILQEVRRAGNIILFINNLPDLMAAESENGQGMDVSGSLSEHLSNSGSLLTLATSSVESYNKHLINSPIGQMFARVEVKEMDENQAIQALESKAGYIEYKQKVFFSYDSIEKAVQYAGRFLHDQKLPESALEILTESASLVRNKKGMDFLVEKDDVAKVISEKTGIPATSLSENEADKLLRLETEMHNRVVGQDEAVNLVANALRRARAEIRSTKRPIANFLFLGPTGVGKTELAKTIAEIYFGGEERMIRVDMSEYQDKTSIYRLIGSPGQKGTGIFTEAVRQKPFSLVLLDELEKADPDILNLFLQVFDDGRLTDNVGRVIDFTNTIIIATSNAGTPFVQTEIEAGKSLEEIRQGLVKGELKKYYRPEFLNRFDGIILFRSLDRGEIKEVAKLMLGRVINDLQNKGIELRVEDSALESLVDVGFDPEFGARPMRRAIQDKVENQLAELVISGKLKRKDVVVLGEGAQLSVTRS